MKKLLRYLYPVALGVVLLSRTASATPFDDLQKVLNADESQTYDEGSGESKQFKFFPLKRAGALVLCENALVNGACSGNGISDILLFAKKGDRFITLYSDPIGKSVLDKLAALIQNKDQVTYVQEGFLVDARMAPSKLGAGPINLTTGINQNGVKIAPIQNTTIFIQDFNFPKTGPFSREFVIKSDTNETENIAEPGALLMLVAGLGTLAAVRRRRVR